MSSERLRHPSAPPLSARGPLPTAVVWAKGQAGGRSHTELHSEPGSDCPDQVRARSGAPSPCQTSLPTRNYCPPSRDGSTGRELTGRGHGAGGSRACPQAPLHPTAACCLPDELPALDPNASSAPEDKPTGAVPQRHQYTHSVTTRRLPSHRRAT